MKIIDLLNKIANGEEVPKEIRFDDMIWNKICGEKNIYYVNENDNDLFIYFFRRSMTFNLNDEVEILEEDKKIEKIDLFDNYTGYNWSRRELCEQLERNFVELNSKINEIIDYLEENKNEN